MPIAKDEVEVLQIKKLLQCVRQEDYAQISKLCEKGVRFLVNYNEPEEGQTPLIVAAVMNNEEMMRFLLERGAHPNIVDFHGRSALMKAAELGHVQAIAVLKDHQADPELRDADGKDVLFYCLSAPTNRHDRCMKAVLSMGAGVAGKTKTGTPIFVEACKNAVEYQAMCLMLLDQGANPNSVEESTQRSALHYAASCGSLDVCRAILRKGGNPNVIDRRKQAPAHEAAVKGHFAVLLLLSAYGAHFDVYDMRGNNPVHLAARVNAGACCRFLATRGCNPKVKNMEGDLPKTIAKDNKAKDASKNIRKAEKQYAKLSRQTNESGGVNWSIRLYDYMHEHEERVARVFGEHDPDQIGKVSKDAFVEVITAEGFQQLVQSEEIKKLIVTHEKAKDEIDYKLFLTGKKYINKLFLISSFEKKKKKKKKPKAKKAKKTKVIMPICVLDEGPRMEEGAPPAIYQPQHVHFTDINRFNRDRPPQHPLQDDSAWYLKNPETAFVNIAHAAKNGDLHTLLDAFKRGLPVDIRDKYFKTPLMVAASKGDLRTVRFLLSCKADPNAYDNFKWTALHHACHTGQLEVVKALVEAGADVNALSMTQGTALFRAVESASYPVVDYLIEKGASLAIQNIKGITVLDLAKDFADPRIFLAIKNKVESLPKPKGDKKDKKKAAKKKPAAKQKKKGDKPEEPAKDLFLPPILMRRRTFSSTEQMFNTELEEEKLLFRPIHAWTEQDTTQQLLEKKQQTRDQYGWEIDFEDYKLPFLKNLSKKMDKVVET